VALSGDKISEPLLGSEDDLNSSQFIHDFNAAADLLKRETSV
jgi:hypothetical protein